uniref:Uncharacterized protein n=1 Tax=Megaselia scalaris TaxID=36166 RepID=T1GQ66_MEGSC
MNGKETFSKVQRLAAILSKMWKKLELFGAASTSCLGCCSSRSSAEVWLLPAKIVRYFVMLFIQSGNCHTESQGSRNNHVKDSTT